MFCVAFASLMEECGNEGSLDQHRLAPDVTSHKLVNGCVYTASVAVLAETDLGGGGKEGWMEKRRSIRACKDVNVMLMY